METDKSKCLPGFKAFQESRQNSDTFLDQIPYQYPNDTIIPLRFSRKEFLSATGGIPNTNEMPKPLPPLLLMN